MVIVLKDNSKQIRDKIESAGIHVCVCAKFRDACWLDYHPCILKEVHGVGYWGEEARTHSQQEELDRFVATVRDPIWCNNVYEFIDKIKQYG